MREDQGGSNVKSFDQGTTASLPRLGASNPNERYTTVLSLQPSRRRTRGTVEVARLVGVSLKLTLLPLHSGSERVITPQRLDDRLNLCQPGPVRPPRRPLDVPSHARIRHFFPLDLLRLPLSLLFLFVSSKSLCTLLTTSRSTLPKWDHYRRF